MTKKKAPNKTLVDAIETISKALSQGSSKISIYATADNYEAGRLYHAGAVYGVLHEFMTTLRNLDKYGLPKKGNGFDSAKQTVETLRSQLSVLVHEYNIPDDLL